MTNKRRRPTPNEMIVLLAEVDRLCPLCSKPLQYKKKGEWHKRVEIAHIYPLNPSADEKQLLGNEERLATDVNAIENFLALCEGCHTEFDKPRTLEEYRRAVLIKKSALARSASREKLWEFNLQEELREVVEALMNATVLGATDGHLLSYNPKTLEEKVGNELDELVKNRIRYEIAAYYPSVREAFRTLQQSNASSAQQILLQVRAYYLEQTKLDLSHTAILRAIADWVSAHTGADTEVSNILASFFVQNCEVF